MNRTIVLFAGRSSRCAFCATGYADGRSAALLADAQVSASRALQADFHSAGTVGAGYTAVGGQLRASVRLHIRLPGGLRTDAIYLIRPLRSQTKDPADLDLSGPNCGPVCLAARPVL